MRNLLVIFLAFIVLGSYSKLSAQSDDWVVIAEKTASFKSDKDKVTPFGAERNVSKIKIKCIQGTVKLKHAHVKMADGTEKTFDAKGIDVLNKGMTSFAFTLPGDKKLDYIELEYDSAGNMLISKYS